MIQTPRVVVALCSISLNRVPRTWHRGQYPVGGPAVSFSVYVCATAVDDASRRAEPQPTCFELLPCKKSHAFIRSVRSDQVPSIRRVKLCRRGAYLGHDEIARTFAVSRVQSCTVFLPKNENAINQSRKKPIEIYIELPGDEREGY